MNYRNRTSKAQSPDKTPFTIFNPHSIDLNERKWMQDYYQVVSIDPSLKNLGFRIERRYINGKIIPIVYMRKNFAPQIPKDENGNPLQEQLIICDYYESITNFLDQYHNEFMNSHFVIIERQLPHNHKAVRISQHVISYFCIKLKNAPLLPIIAEVDSKLKSRQLGAPKGLGERQVKQWLIEKAKELLQMRGDKVSYNHLMKEKKKDDLADIVCQVEALFSYMKLPTTINIEGTTNPLNELARTVGSSGSQTRLKIVSDTDSAGSVSSGSASSSLSSFLIANSFDLSSSGNNTTSGNADLQPIKLKIK